MPSNNVKELWGVEFSVVPDGLAEEQVVNYVNGLISRSQEDGAEQDRHSPLFKLAEQTVVEAHQIAESTKEEARREAETEAARIRAKAEENAQEQAQQILETARNEAAAKSNKIVANAEEEAQHILRSTRSEAHDILQAAKQTAEDLQSQAKLEAEYTVRKLQAKLTEEIRSGVTKICNNLLPSLNDSVDGFDDKVDVPNGEAAQPATAFTQVKMRTSAKR